MATFKSLKELEKHLKQNPGIVHEQNKGKKITRLCATCKEERQMVLVDNGMAKCQTCNNEFKVKIEIV